MNHQSSARDWKVSSGEIIWTLDRLLFGPYKHLLEQFRFAGSSNRVYRIPLGGDDEFIIVKLLPHRLWSLRFSVKRVLRNLLYAEHMESTRRNRSAMETERIIEWRSEGFLVPPVVRCDYKNVRVLRGVDLPTFYTILSEAKHGHADRLKALGLVTASLYQQHTIAIAKQRPSLLHKDPGPWNVMVDLDQDQVWWFDLEHAADYRFMNMEELVRRSLRIYIFGILEHLGGSITDVIPVLKENYPAHERLDNLISHIDRRRKSLRGRSLMLLQPKTKKRVDRLLDEFGPELRRAIGGG